MSLTCAAGSLSSTRISRICFSLSLSLRPPTRPLARAAVRPARVRSRIRLRSNSAKAAKTWNCNFPEALPVSIFSVKLSKVMLSRSRSAMIFTRSERERPSRSSRQTTKVSPDLKAFRQCSVRHAAQICQKRSLRKSQRTPNGQAHRAAGPDFGHRWRHGRIRCAYSYV